MVRLIKEWERINGGDFILSTKKSAYFRALPESAFKVFRGDLHLDIDAMAIRDLELNIDQYIRNNVADKTPGLNSLEAEKDKNKDKDKDDPEKKKPEQPQQGQGGASWEWLAPGELAALKGGKATPKGELQGQCYTCGQWGSLKKVLPHEHVQR